MTRCQILNYAIQYIKQLYSFLDQDNKEKEINNGQLKRIQNEWIIRVIGIFRKRRKTIIGFIY